MVVVGSSRTHTRPRSLVVLMSGVVLGVMALLQTSKSSTDVLRLALETIVTLLTASKDTAAVLELVHADSRKLRSFVVLRGIVVSLMNRNGGVNNIRLDSLLVDYRLDSLVDVLSNVSM